MIALILTLLPALQDDEPVELHWGLLGTFAAGVSGRRPEEARGDFVLAEERVRLEASGGLKDVDLSFRARLEAFHDAVENEARVDLREAHVDYRTGPLDLRLGRQVATWGVGDLLFINDVFPKDWVSFFAGRPMEYFKVPIDALKVGVSSEVVNAEAIVAPFFEPDIVPDPDRFFVFDPFPGLPRERDEPDSTYGNTELALRVYRQIAETDVSLHVTKGFWKTPSMEPAGANVRLFYPALSTYGLSAQRNLFGGVASLEVGYYDSREDRPGDDPAIPNSEFRFLLGYQREIATDFTIGVQYFLEWMQEHKRYDETLPPGFPEQDEFRHTVTLRLTHFFDYQAWKVSLFALYGVSEVDFMIVPEVTHKFSDRFRMTLEAHVFGGRSDETRFGSSEWNDNVSLSFRFDF